MHERLDLDIGGPGKPADLPERQCALQNHTRKTRFGEETNALRIGIAHLRRSMQFDRRQLHPKEGHILHDQRIGSRIPHPACDTLRIGQFLFIKQRVHRYIDLRSETMGEVTQPDDLLLGNTRRRTRAETRCAHVQRIGTAQNSRTSLFIILGRG